mmetsp:Transcript_55327/g.91526  ORF Transcript_55327/g.91526 Transcript_55327/m.91526 type:complete len:254 (-) Transcript_55327:141-902(-)
MDFRRLIPATRWRFTSNSYCAAFWETVPRAWKVGFSCFVARICSTHLSMSGISCAGSTVKAQANAEKSSPTSNSPVPPERSSISELADDEMTDVAPHCSRSSSKISTVILASGPKFPRAAGVLKRRGHVLDSLSPSFLNTLRMSARSAPGRAKRCERCLPKACKSWLESSSSPGGVAVVGIRQVGVVALALALAMSSLVLAASSAQLLLQLSAGSAADSTASLTSIEALGVGPPQSEQLECCSGDSELKVMST